MDGQNDSKVKDATSEKRANIIDFSRVHKEEEIRKERKQYTEYLDCFRIFR